MGNLVQDLRYAIRTLGRAPGFAIVAVLTIALGIGANTAIFSLVNAVILQPLPFREPSRLIAAWDTYQPQFSKLGVSPVEMNAWSEQRDLFEETAWYRWISKDLNLLAPGIEPVTVHATFVSPRFFTLFGVAPAFGNSLANSPDSVVLSHRLWRARFASDPAVAGRTIRLNNQPFVVAGVMPENFQFPDFAEVWIAKGPLLNDEATNPVRHAMGFVARLRSGVTEKQAVVRLQSIAQRLAAANPKTSKGWGVNIFGLQDDLTAKTRPALLMLAGAVALVLLIACVNVANLLLARASGRTKEIAVRSALGAGASRIVRQLLTESLLLSLLGGAIGIAIGRAALLALSPIPAPLDYRVMLFLAGVSIVTGVLFGIVPALHALDPDSNSLIKSGAARGGRASAMRSTLVVAEFSIALVLVAGAAILLKSFLHLMNVDPGFQTRGLLTMRLSLPDSQKPDALFRRIEERVRQIPGVDLFAATNALPLTFGHGNSGRFIVQGSALANAEVLPIAQYRTVSPDYFAAMHIPVLAGRVFTERDLADNVVIINQNFARRFWPDRNPIGEKYISDPWSIKPVWATIVGIVGDVKQFGLDSEQTLDLYTPSLYPGSIVIHTAGDPNAIVAAVRAAIHAVDPDLPISEIRTMDQVLEASAASRRWTMLLLSSFAGLALVLALVGIYGVMSWSVAQRTREIGIRMALGAGASQVRASVIANGLKLSLMGTAIGLAGAFALRQFLATLVYDTSTADPAIYSAVAAIMMLVAAFACYLPARKASKVDPLIALRSE